MNPRKLSSLMALEAMVSADAPKMGYAAIERGRLIEADANLCRIFACPSSETLTGCSLDSLAAGGEADRLIRYLSQAADSAAPLRFAFRARRRDGASVDLEVCAVPTNLGAAGVVFAIF